MEAFQRALIKLDELEGTFSNHASDRGGATMYGITEAVAREWGWTEPMEEMPRDLAEHIYIEGYWRYHRLTRVAERSYPLAEFIFTSSVNMSPPLAPSRSVRWLQRALVLANGADIEQDGLLGSATLAALDALLARRHDGREILLRAINGQAVAFYLDITERRPQNEDFIYGWLRKRTLPLLTEV